MKKSRKILSVILALTIVMYPSLLVHAIPLQDNGDMSYMKSYLSVDIYTKIYETLKMPGRSTDSMDAASLNSADKFSDEYAGTYIDDEGNLILQFVDGSAEKYNSIVSDTLIFETIEENENSTKLSSSSKKKIAHSIVKIEEKPFSFNELMETKEKITDKFENLGLSIVLKQKTNSVDVFYSDDTLIEKVKEYVKAELGVEREQMVKFIYKENCIEQPCKSAYPGNKIYYNSGFLGILEVPGTIGFNAYYGGKWGVVTNSHVAPLGEKMKCADGTLNKPTFSYIGGKLDVAFIPYPDGWTPTSGLTTDNGEIIYSEATQSELIEGGLVEKYGIITGHTKNGRIISTSVNISVNYDDGTKTIRDCFKYSNPSEKGDSGGPVGFGKTKSVFRLIGINFAKESGASSGIKLSNIKTSYPMTVKTGY